MVDVKDKKAYSFSIVLIGNFSPGMFQPYWFKHCGILDDYEFAAIERNKDKLIVSSAITAFETENFAFRIEEKRFTLIAKKEPFELLLDAFEKLQEKLDSVLIEKFGMNFSFHVDFRTYDNLKKFGDVIAPKQYWSTLFCNMADDECNKSGLATMTMRKQTEFGCINVKIESSTHFKNSVFFDFNFHFDGNPDEPFDILDVNDAVNERFKEFTDYSDEITCHLVDEVINNG